MKNRIRNEYTHKKLEVTFFIEDELNEGEPVVAI